MAVNKAYKYTLKPGDGMNAEVQPPSKWPLLGVLGFLSCLIATVVLVMTAG